LNPKTQEACKSQKPKPSTCHSGKRPDNKELKASDAIHIASEKSNTEGHVRGLLFCPKCGSPDVYWASGLPQLWSVWDCRNCGYRGALILRDSKLAKKLREEYAKFAKR